MAAASGHGSSQVSWWQRFTTPAAGSDCLHSRGLWNRVRLRPPGILLNGRRYCLEHCLQDALGATLHHFRLSRPRQAVSHRIPLGLLLLSRKQLSAEQLQLALECQRTQARGRIGEWLQALGFVTEQQVTAALARQWTCPVLQTPAPLLRSGNIPSLPISLLTRFVILPVKYVAPTSTMRIAFAEEIDYSLLYAIEQMTDCRTEPCLAPPSFLRGELQALTVSRQQNAEIVLENFLDDAETSRIILGYGARFCATEIRMAQCAPYLWVRLLRASRLPFDLLFGSPSPSVPSPLELRPA